MPRGRRAAGGSLRRGVFCVASCRSGIGGEIVPAAAPSTCHPEPIPASSIQIARQVNLTPVGQSWSASAAGIASAARAMPAEIRISAIRIRQGRSRYGCINRHRSASHPTGARLLQGVRSVAGGKGLLPFLHLLGSRSGGHALFLFAVPVPVARDGLDVALIEGVDTFRIPDRHHALP